MSLSKYWSVPRAFPGGTIAVLASGESMSQQVADQVHAAGIPAIVINSTFRLAPWAWMLYAADTEWWLHEKNTDAHQFAGLKVSCQPLRGVHQLRVSGVGGFDSSPTAVRTGHNSGYQSVHIAAHTGAKRILLCGMDMHGGHWHGNHPHGLRETPQESYPKWAAKFDELDDPFKSLGISVVNVTPGSAIKCFPFSTLENELACAAH